MLPGVATVEQKIEAEVRMRELLHENGLPAPDAVEYGYTCIRLFWDEQKVAIVVDIDNIDGDRDADPGEADSG